jgi:serine/threonine-protein kinase
MPGDRCGLERFVSETEVLQVSQNEPLPEIGQVVAGKYRIERLLGQGGMGAVFAAHHELLGQDVALKLMLKEHASTPQAVTRFLNEARAAARIEGEHVARVLDVGQLEGGALYIALELLEGSDLAAVLEQRGRLPPFEAVDWILQALEAIAQAHALGVVHRDLKPANLFLASKRDGGRVIKVLDFGISKQSPLTTGSAGVVTTTASVMGSPAYMAPEQLRDARAVDARADIWAIGVVLYELLAGRPPFAGETMAQLFVAVLEQTPPPLRTCVPDVAPELEAVVMRCLAQQADERFENVADLAEALAPFAANGTHPSVASVRAHIARGQAEAAPRDPSPQLPGPAATSAPRPPHTSAHWTTEAPRTARPRRGPLLVAVGIVCAIGIAATVRSIISKRAALVPAAGAAALIADTAPSTSSSPVVGPPSLSVPTATAAPPLAESAPPAPPRTSPARPSRPAGAGSAAASAGRRPPSAAPRPSCKPNFYLDDQGEKHFKPECFAQ